MIDSKVRSLLAVAETHSFTRAAEELHLTQPAVSHHIRQLEQDYGIKIFKIEKKELTLTPEGEVLLKYARRITAVAEKARTAIEDSRQKLRHLTIGITQTSGENCIPQVLALYCNEHPETHIQIITDSINNLYNGLELYQLDLAILDGAPPSQHFHSVLLDTDHLCLAVSPQHPFATRTTVSLNDLKGEKLILRSRNAGTRMIFDSFLLNHSEDIRNFHVMMELDNLATLKDLVALNMGVTIISRSACRDDVRQGRLALVPIDNASMTREIRLVYPYDFSHTDIIDDLRKIYNRIS